MVGNVMSWFRFALVALVMAGCGAPEPVPSSESESSAANGESSVVAPGGEVEEPEGASGAGECSSDSDCVQDACCHATGCVPRGSGPACDDVACTDECATPLDCEASCVCSAGRCSVSESR